ncbi:hypothetical protein BDV98DRAFT_586798 [Pterulicium gracile]|uniref:Uncharacterized protein n=1 Tax=Pterulicium gracile TaxID=1884261 RepID=A0A5C3Q179_9AGAR|nr:hypothetical protein BDV98DRAFT_586798 [Pterula gracilis]
MDFIKREMVRGTHVRKLSIEKLWDWASGSDAKIETCRMTEHTNERRRQWWLESRAAAIAPGQTTNDLQPRRPVSRNTEVFPGYEFTDRKHSDEEKQLRRERSSMHKDRMTFSTTWPTSRTCDRIVRRRSTGLSHAGMKLTKREDGLTEVEALGECGCAAAKVDRSGVHEQSVSQGVEEL